MNRKKILLRDFGKLSDVVVETQPRVVDLVGSANKRANETQFVGKRCETDWVISQKARKGFLMVNTILVTLKWVSFLKKTSNKGTFWSISFSMVNLILGYLELM